MQKAKIKMQNDKANVEKSCILSCSFDFL